MSDTQPRPTIRSHWYRNKSGYLDGSPCCMTDCGRPQAEHVEAVGEWMDPVHWHRPRLLRPLWCAACGRHAAHSTHRGSREWRRLRRR